MALKLCPKVVVPECPMSKCHAVFDEWLRTDSIQSISLVDNEQWSDSTGQRNTYHSQIIELETTA